MTESSRVDASLQGCWDIRVASQYAFSVPDVGEASDRFIAELQKILSVDFPESHGHRIEVRHRVWK